MKKKAITIELPVVEKRDVMRLAEFFGRLKWEFLLLVISCLAVITSGSSGGYLIFLILILSLVYLDIWTGWIRRASGLIAIWLKSRAYINIFFFFLIVIAVIWRAETIWLAAIVALYIFMSFDSLRKSIMRLYRRLLHDASSHKLESALIIVVISSLISWSAGGVVIFFTAIFLVFLLFGWDARITAGAAIVSLSACPVLFFYKQEDWASSAALFSFYFLLATSVLELVRAYSGSVLVAEATSLSPSISFRNFFKMSAVKQQESAEKASVESDYRQYLLDIDMARDEKKRKGNEAFATFAGWLADAIRVTGKAIEKKIDRFSLKTFSEIPEGKSYSVNSPSSSERGHVSLDFLDTTPFMVIRRQIAMISRVVFSWQIIVNLVIVAACFGFSYSALVAGDTVRMVIKLGSGLFIIMFANSMIYGGQKASGRL